MKAVFLVLSFLLYACSNKEDSHTSNTYDNASFIAIEHTGREEYPIATLIVSTKEVRSKFVEKRISTNKGLSRSKIDAYLYLNYNFVVTHAATYQAIISFVNKNQYFFTNNKNKNHGDYLDYSITIEGKTYNIFYKLKSQFFNELVMYLEANKGDIFVIAALKRY